MNSMPGRNLNQKCPWQITKFPIALFLYTISVPWGRFPLKNFLILYIGAWYWWPTYHQSIRLLWHFLSSSPLSIIPTCQFSLMVTAATPSPVCLLCLNRGDQRASPHPFIPLTLPSLHFSLPPLIISVVVFLELSVI